MVNVGKNTQQNNRDLLGNLARFRLNFAFKLDQWSKERKMKANHDAID